jgi:hypothetical protein
MTICVCDDGKRADVKTMFNEVSTNLRQMGVRVTLKYIARTKDPKVYHHAKAGNLNNAILGKDEEGRQLTQGKASQCHEMRKWRGVTDELRCVRRRLPGHLRLRHDLRAYLPGGPAAALLRSGELI